LNENLNEAKVIWLRGELLLMLLLPQINSLFAVELVALLGMLTGQILSGVDPNIAVRYQTMVMWMVFGSGGIIAVIYLSPNTKNSTKVIDLVVCSKGNGIPVSGAGEN
jgi:ABC-type iron transport system FetAB permease component